MIASITSDKKLKVEYAYDELNRLIAVRGKEVKLHQKHIAGETSHYDVSPAICLDAQARAILHFTLAYFLFFLPFSHNSAYTPAFFGG